MISQTSDPDIETIYSRITKEIYDLQPDFQRGEIWSVDKKRKLIDSILREWHIPPIHLVYVKETGTHEVLDGQQRLVAIRDFINNRFSVSGDEIPYDENIKELDGLKFSQLPNRVKNQFLEYTIRIFIIKEYSPEEPGELFYRLNQSTSLSPAEQRNSFYGIPRNQIKGLSKYMQKLGLNKGVIGFSNARMAHDDMLAKFCFTLENETYLKPASSKNITTKYRRGEPFSDIAIQRAEEALYIFYMSSEYFEHEIKFNKSTMYSLLCFIARLVKKSKVNIMNLGKFIYNFEKSKNTQIDVFYCKYNLNVPKKFLESLYNIYNDRASYRAENISSIRLRDLILWILFYLSHQNLEYNSSYQVEDYRKLAYLIDDLLDTESEAELTIMLERFLEFEWRTSI